MLRMVDGEGEGETYHPLLTCLSNDLHLPHIPFDSHATGYPLVDLQKEDSLGMAIRNDMREMKGSHGKV